MFSVIAIAFKSNNFNNTNRLGINYNLDLLSYSFHIPHQELFFLSSSNMRCKHLEYGKNLNRKDIQVKTCRHFQMQSKHHRNSKLDADWSGHKAVSSAHYWLREGRFVYNSYHSCYSRSADYFFINYKRIQRGILNKNRY